MEKEIAGFPDYTITDKGQITSYKHKTPKIMTTWYQKSGYENIVLSKNCQIYRCLVHRLVAQTFIPNPFNLPEVNHKDKNRANNTVENLEWSTRIDNLYDSYSTTSPTRNFRECYLTLIDSTEPIQYFQSIAEAARYASVNYGCSETGLIRNHKSKGYKIEYLKSVTTKKDENLDRDRDENCPVAPISMKIDDDIV